MDVRNLIGYACINETLSKEGVRVNRNLILKTFQEKGLPYVSELIINNLDDLLKILQWNMAYGIYNFRLPSEIFPWKTKYEYKDLPNFNIIHKRLKAIGLIIQMNKMRISFHPDHFCVLSSPKEDVVLESIKELEKTAQIFDLMGLPKTHEFKINIHIGGVYGSKLSACDRFCNNFNLLSDSVKLRLTVENDDKLNSYNVHDLYHLIYKRIGTPIVFDYHHHMLNDGDILEKEALELALSTWDKSIIPIVHYSSSKKINEDNNAKEQAHANLIYEDFDTYGHDIAIIFEAKSKEMAVINYKLYKGYIKFVDKNELNSELK